MFLAPPWPEIYETDPERRHGLDVALAEYSRLLETYPSLGYAVLILPKVRVSERADFILNTLEGDPFTAGNGWVAHFTTGYPTAVQGHEDAFPRPGPSDRCRLGQETFAGTSANG